MKKTTHKVSPRIIPAYAGSTPFRLEVAPIVKGSSPHTRGAPPHRRGWVSGPVDHPRIRGEHHRGACLAPLRAGIIPAYAGSTRLDVQNLVLGDGIIPAYAGSTMSSTGSSHTYSGSSPHTRGALHAARDALVHREDHPRIRGEHDTAAMR